MVFRLLESDNVSNSDNNTNNKGNSENNTNAANETFRTLLFIIIGVLCLFLCFFVYNLIKCYLPKWMNKDRNRLESEGNSVEFEKI